MLKRLHRLANRIGISPKVLDPFIGAVALILFNWLALGHGFDVDGLRLAAGLFVLGVIGVSAPPAGGVDQYEVAEMGVRREHRGRPPLRRR